MKIYNRLYSSLGICRRAGKMVLGTAAVEKYIINKKAKLVILSSNLSERTISRFDILCKNNDIDILIIDDNGYLGKSVGRDDIKIVAITDYSFKKIICEIYNEESGVSDVCQT